jgi:prepilin-type processing-associated H-X9-DG protein
MPFKDNEKNTDFSNFPAKKNLSYSYANSYGEEKENPFTFNLPAEFVIAGDMNPGGKELFNIAAPAANVKSTVGNSANHQSEGGNFLFADGHVEFDNTPLVGVNHDNVYTPGAEGETVIAAPVNASDTVLLPTAEQDGDAAK